MLEGNVYNVGLRIGRNGLEVLGGCYDDFQYGSQRGGRNEGFVSWGICVGQNSELFGTFMRGIM